MAFKQQRNQPCAHVLSPLLCVHSVRVCALVQFRLREPALLKLAEQLSAGPPSSLLKGWQQPPAALFLNKQDKLPAEVRSIVLEQLGKQLCSIAKFDSVLHGAAMLGEGVDELREFFLNQVSRPGRAAVWAHVAHISCHLDV